MSHALRLKVMFIVSLAIIVVGGAIYMVTDLYIEKQHFEEKWNKQMYQSIEVMSTLQDVKAYMGFGGFIHHYKNYLLRRDANYLILMRESGHNLEQAIEDLREAFLRGEDDKNAPHFQALNALKQNYFNYLEKSELLAKYIHEGKSVAEMDQLVRIDDDVAIRALDFLDKYSLEHHHDILSDIQNEVDHIENLAKLGIFIVPLIILLAVLLIRSLLRLDKSSRDARFARDAMVRLINAAPDALIVVNRDGQFVRFNDSAPKLFGYSGDELAGLQLEDLLPAELRASHTGLRKSFFDEPKVRGMASRLNIWAHHSSGRAFPIEVSLSYMNEGSETLAVALVYDISDRVRFEQSKEEFVSIMAHELRTPVTAINGALSMIQNASTLSDDQRLNLMDVALRNGTRLESLVQDILDMREIMAGQLSVSTSEIGLNAIVRDVINAYQGLANERGVGLETGGIKEPVYVKADLIKLKKVVSELIENAIKFSPKNSLVNIDIQSDDELSGCKVTNSGAGIPEGSIDLIFNRFEQIDSADTRSYAGTGMGLYICKSYLKAMQGDIKVNSVVNGQTEFTFCLPTALVSQQQAG